VGVLLAVQFIPVLSFVSVEGFTVSVVESIAVLFLEVLLFPFVVLLLSQLWTASLFVVYTLAKLSFSLYDRDKTLDV
jgi:hypothetical protein